MKGFERLTPVSSESSLRPGRPQRGLSRRGFLRLLAIAGGSGLAGSLLAACGGASSSPTAASTTSSSSSSGGAGSTPASSSSSSTSTSTTTTTSGSGAVQLAATQEFRRTNTEPGHIDPNLASSGNEVTVVLAMYDGLLVYDVNNKAIPLCAEKWDISSDAVNYTFHLRQGMKWTDGHPVTAGDFEYSWKRLADPATASEYASASYILKGAQDFNTGKTKDPSTIGVKAVDDHTLSVTLAEPAAYFLHVAATWSYMPVPKWAVDKFGPKWVEPGNNVSNGAFKLDSWQHDQQMTLTRFEGYYGPKPTLEKVVYTITADPTSTSINAFQNNELDLSAQITPTQIDQITGSSTLSKQIVKSPGSSTTMLFFDTSNTNSPASKPEVRRALYLALDLNKIANDAFKGLDLPAPTVTPSNIAGYNPSAAPKGGVAEAKKQLAAAGYPGGKGFPTFTLVWGQNTDYDLLGQILQQMWQENLGIKVTLQRQETKSFRSFFDSLAKPENHYDFYIWGWGSDYYDPNDWYNILWESDQDFFHTRWKNDQFDNLVKQADKELDDAKRKQMYQQAETILMNDMPVLPILHGETTELVKPWVKQLNLLDYKYLSKIQIAKH